MRLLSLFLLCIFSFVACKNDSKPSVKPTIPLISQQAVSKKYKLTPFTPSPAFSDAKIESMTYKAGKFDFKLAQGNYKLGVQTTDAPQKMCANSAKGQHIHLIVDNAPYAAKYVNEFDYDIADGDHHVLAFLSRSYHESIKSPTAYVAQKISVKDKSISTVELIESPMLFYSRPKGTYVGKKDTEKIMLDFYLTNAQLGGNYSVEATINGEKHSLKKWQPYYIEGLPMGENTIKLTLLDKNGAIAKVPLNPVMRTFTLKEDPVEQ